MDILKVKVNGEWVGIPAITGEKGEDGFSPSAAVTKSGGTSTITITDKTGTTTAQVTDGVPAADAAQIKAGTDSGSAITPATQDASAFYALAKLAGVDLASQTVTPGTYPDAAKVAIQKMLGIYEAPWELIREDTFTNATEADVDITVDGNGNAFELTDFAMIITMPNQNIESKCTTGRVVVNSGQSSTFEATIDVVTRAAGATDSVSQVLVTQEKGMVFVRTVPWSNVGTIGSLRSIQSYSGSRLPYRLTSDPLIMTAIKIRTILGTANYTLYGKRKWN